MPSFSILFKLSFIVLCRLVPSDGECLPILVFYHFRDIHDLSDVVGK